jgi:16S rRNA (cytosine967-C5)-methyltransferase
MPKPGACQALIALPASASFLFMSEPATAPTADLPDARAVALDLLSSVLWRKQALDDTLAAHHGLAALSPRDRAFARQLVGTALRRLGQIDALIAQALATPLPARARPVTDVLRLGVTQLLFLGTPAHAAVSTAVALVETAGHRKMKALVNAVLRRLSRDGAALIAAQDEARLNTPPWLWQSWCGAYGEDQARAIAKAHLRDPPLDLTLKDQASAPYWAARLNGAVLPTGTIRRDTGAVTELPGFGEGAWWVQDAAATLPVRLFGDVAGKTVIDLCAAPGGKTAQLAAAGGHVVAVDRSGPRLDRIKQNLARLELEAERIEADAVLWRPPQPAAFVLLDAPCSATGTIRRHPDIAHLKSADDVARLSRTQDRLLDAAIAMLAPGGTLVYCVCSLEAKEGPRRIERLLAAGAPVARRAIESAEIGGLSECLTAEGDLRTLPCHLAEQGGMDGFYAARLLIRLG